MATYGGKVGLMWANSVDDSVRFATHDDGSADDACRPPAPRCGGFASSKNDLALHVLPGDAGQEPLVFAAAKSAPEDASAANKLGPQLLVLSLQPDATWKQHVAGQIRDEHAQPVLAVDREQRLLYVFATFPAAGGSINYKVARADRIAFPVGVGTPLVASDSDTALIDHASSTKQAVDRSTGLVVLASDDDAGTYFHGVLDLGGVPAGTASAGDRQPSPAGAAAGPTDLAHTTFDPLAPGRPLDPGWVTESLDPGGQVTVAAVTSAADHSARAASGPSGRTCRSAGSSPRCARATSWSRSTSASTWPLPAAPCSPACGVTTRSPTCGSGATAASATPPAASPDARGQGGERRLVPLDRGGPPGRQDLRLAAARSLQRSRAAHGGTSTVGRPRVDHGRTGLPEVS